MKRQVLFVVVTLLLGACNSHQERTRVGGIDFCVPTENRYEVDIWWIPRKTPSEGFTFVLPAMHDGFTKGGKVLTGLVDDSRRYADWKNPKPGTQFRKELLSREGRTLVAQGPYIASSSSDAYTYLVWKPETGPVSLNSEFTDTSELMAECVVPKAGSTGVERKSSCTRVILLGAVAVQYTFDDSLLGYIDLLDKRVTSAVSGWRCQNS